MKYFLKPILIVLLVVINGCKKSSPVEKNGAADYLDHRLPVAERVTDLLSRMTLEEKIGQMTQAGISFLNNDQDISKFYLGSLLSGGGVAPGSNVPVEWADMYDKYQNIAISTRLKIPLIYGIDAVHGHNNVSLATIFPHNIGMGCTQNPALVKQAQAAAAKEVAGTGIDWTFAPCIAVPQDERWGRTYEGFAETPELTMQMSMASVNGFQGADLAARETILACAKHFVGDGGTVGGDDQGDTQMDEATLREIHLPGYEAAIQAGVGSIMVSFSSWNGLKMHAHKYLLTDVLKNELGFDGFLISDWAGINQIPGDFRSDIKISINAGLDMVMVPDHYELFISNLKSLVEDGSIPQSRIDDAVSRILTIKFKLGLFEQPLTDRSLTASIGSDAHRNLARECVRQSLVLLKNENQILPLRKDSLKIHVAGKNADNLGYQCGGWSISWQGHSGEITLGTTILQAIKKAVSGLSEVNFSMDGSNAGDADVAIAVVGETPYAEGAGDRSDLSLFAEDVSVIQNLKGQGIPVIMLLVSGRPMILEAVLQDCDAVLAVWLPGTEGDGVADVIFGDYSPSGKLGHSWPQNMAQIPINVGDANYSPLFPYGYGLTYN